jgi:hypothetical protein
LIQEQGPLLKWLNRKFPSATNIAAYCHEAVYPNARLNGANGLLQQVYVTAPILAVTVPIEGVVRGIGSLLGLGGGGC